MLRVLLLGSLFVVGATAQTLATVPTLTTFQDVDRPLAGGVGRYQQWYAASDLDDYLPEPMRIDRVEFFAGSGPSAIATTIDCEILLGHGQTFGVTGSFDNNFASAPVVVAPRTNRQLTAGAPGAVVMNIPFATLFTWDRQRPLLMEIRVYGNGQANQPFSYTFRGSTVAFGKTSRVYQAGSTGAATGTVASNTGMLTRFTARPGALVDFGAGCVGGGGFTPKNVILEVPQPGILWTHQLTQAAPQQLALWVIGADRNMIDGIPLPIDFPQLLGTGPSGCMLRTNIIVSGFHVTVGGAPGAGFATFSWQLPPIGNYVGDHWYSQWFVLDPICPNGLLTATQGIESIVAP